MSCFYANPVQRRYVIQMFVTAMLCIFFSVLAVVGFRITHATGALAYVLGALPALPIMAALVLTGVYLDDEKDEFQRNLLVQSLLGGIGATLSLTTLWGNLEDFAHAQHLGLTWIYPLFWGFSGLSYFVVRLRYR